MNLLEKLEGMEVEEVKKELPPDDQEYLSNYIDRYFQIYQDYVDAWRALFPVFSKSKSEKAQNHLQQVLYDIQEKIVTLNRIYITQLIFYFNKKYDIRIGFTCEALPNLLIMEEEPNEVPVIYRYQTKKSIQKINFSKLIDFIREETNNFDFRAMAINLMIAHFRSDLKGHKVTLKNKRLKFEKFFLYGSITQRERFLRLLSLFEADCSQTIDAFKVIQDHYANVYNFDTLKRIKRIKVYNNNNVEVLFSSAKAAEEFHRTYCILLE